MNERREPTISTYAPTKEDVARHQRSQSGANKSRTTTRSSASAASVKPVIVKSKLAPVAFLVALLTSGAAGFLYWQLLEVQKFLAQADERIADLESKFELSDDESTASTQTMQAKLKWADAEIRKLWGVSYDTNRKAIAANKDTIAKVSKTANAASKSIDTKIKTATGEMTAELKLVSDLVDAQQVSLSAIEQNNAQILSQSRTITDKLNRLENLEKELERRIVANENAIEAIDAFRRSVNQQLLDLKGG